MSRRLLVIVVGFLWRGYFLDERQYIEERSKELKGAEERSNELKFRFCRVVGGMVLSLHSSLSHLRTSSLLGATEGSRNEWHPRNKRRRCESQLSVLAPAQSS